MKKINPFLFLLSFIFFASCSVQQFSTDIIKPVDNNEDTLSNYFHYAVNVDYKITNKETFFADLKALAKQKDGYISELSDYMVVLDIPRTELESVLAHLAENEKIIALDYRTENHTENFNNYSLELQHATNTRNTYLKLLNEAVTVEEVLLVETELGRINQSIELLQTYIIDINQKTQYATVTVRIENLYRPGPIGHIFVGLYKSVKWLFVRS